jgi:predicted nucleic acid-binding protein
MLEVHAQYVEVGALRATMKPFRVYLDTSVLGGAFDEEFKEDTEALLELIRVGKVRPVVSEQVEIELNTAPDAVQDLLDELLLGFGAENLRLTEEARSLASSYIAAGVVAAKHRADALHIALATLAKVDVLVSWNFKHIVNLHRIRGFNGVNLIQGYGTLEIRSPKEVSGNGN